MALPLHFGNALIGGSNQPNARTVKNIIGISA